MVKWQKDAQIGKKSAHANQFGVHKLRLFSLEDGAKASLICARFVIVAA